MTYVEKLKDPRWQKKRLEIFERDKWTCQRCGEKAKTLHVHHFDYFPHTDPWDYKERFLTTLCADCHEEETIKIKNYEENLILILREEGFFTTDIIRLIRFIQGFTDEFAGRVKNVS